METGSWRPVGLQWRAVRPATVRGSIRNPPAQSLLRHRLRSAPGLLLALVAALGLGPPAAAQQPETGSGSRKLLELSRLTGPIVLDGLSDEPAWQEVPALPAVMHSPTFGAVPTERTELRVAYGRVVGRVGQWDVGALSMQTAADDELAGENFGVVLDEGGWRSSWPAP